MYTRKLQPVVATLSQVAYNEGLSLWASMIESEMPKGTLHPLSSSAQVSSDDHDTQNAWSNDVHPFKHAVTSHLINQMIREMNRQKDLGDAENGLTIVTAEIVECQSLLRQVVEFCRLEPAGCSKVLSLELDGQTYRLLTDSVLLRSVVDEMVRNALEASSEQEVVTVGCSRVRDNVEVWVHNEGRIPREIQSQIFRRSCSTNQFGKGLGTYSMKLLTERYLGGKISFSTSLDDGTRFSLFLPQNIPFS